MKEEHKELIEHIISEFKNSENGIIHRSNLKEILSNNDDDVISSVWNLIIKNLKLVESVVGENYNYTLTKAGYDFVSFKDNEAKELALNKKEQVEFEKSKIDLDLAKKMLKEYPYTKWFARISILIAVALAVLEIIRWKDK